MRKMIKKIIARINQFLGEISGWLLCAIMLLLTIDFVSRGLSVPVHGVGEIAVFVMVAVVYFGLGHTEATGGHVRVTAITSRLPKTGVRTSYATRRWTPLPRVILICDSLTFSE